MQIATDETGKVWMVGDSVPEGEWNGFMLKAHKLTKEQEAAWHALPAERGGTVLNGAAFEALPAPEPAPKTATLADIIAVLTPEQQKALAERMKS